MLRTTVVTELAALKALAPAWDELLGRAAENELPLSPAWLLPWWEVYGDRARALRVLAFHDGDRLVGLAPLLARTYLHRRALPFRRLEMVGSGETQADETCGDYLGIAVEHGHEREVVSAMVEAIVAKKAGRWDELVIASMNGDGVVAPLLHDTWAAHTLDVVSETYSCAPYIALPKTWDEYMASLKSSKRSQLKKSLKAFEAWAGGPPEMFYARTPAQLTEARRVLEELHGERWTAGGVFASSQFRDFHGRVMTELLGRGALDVGWLAVRGQPIAAFYNFVWNGHVSFYQAGRRLDVPEEVRVGMTMHAYLIRDAIARGLREYDFMEGASQYKMSLATATRPLVRMRVVRKGCMREHARRLMERGVEVAKRIRANRRPNG